MDQVKEKVHKKDVKRMKARSGRMKKFHEHLNFYHTYFQFNPEFYVITDDTFIFSTIANEKLNIGHYLSQYFKAKCKIFTTSCVLTELKKRFTNIVSSGKIDRVVKKMHTYSCECNHAQETNTVSQCIEAVANQNQFKKIAGCPLRKQYRQFNAKESRYIVATQNENLMLRLREMPGVPVIYFDGSRLVMDGPSELSRKWVQFRNLSNMEKLAIDKEIFDHSTAPANTDCESTTTTTIPCNKTKIPIPKEKTEMDDGNRNLKRKRENSPDICDISQVINETEQLFQKYKMLVNVDKV